MTNASARTRLRRVLPSGCLTDVPGLAVGHYTDLENATGCTVILAPRSGAVAGADVRGGAPSTRGVDVLAPLSLVERVHALVLTGGSAFGLDSLSGVMSFLEERGIGFDTGAARVPIVAGAVIYDLGVGNPRIRPDRQAGYAACQAAGATPCEQGSVGAGTGATVGKLFGIERAMKGGLGCAGVRASGGVVVAALAVVNSFGDVRDWRTGKQIAGPRKANGRGVVSTVEEMKKGYVRRRFGKAATRTGSASNTTLAVVATNAKLSKVETNKVAQMAHDGLALAISPVHTMFDGDVTFALSVGKVKSDVNLIGALAVECVADAIVNAVRRSEELWQHPLA